MGPELETSEYEARPVAAQPDSAGARSIARTSSLRRRVLPRRLSQSARSLWRARIARPQLSEDETTRLREIFDADLCQLGAWLGVTLDCENFDAVTRAQPHSWTACGLDGQKTGAPSNRESGVRSC